MPAATPSRCSTTSTSWPSSAYRPRAGSRRSIRCRRRLVSRPEVVQVAHAKTSGEAEWALIVGDGPDDLLLTVACDHTDRALEVHGVAWSKQTAPDVLGDVAWPLADDRG